MDTAYIHECTRSADRDDIGGKRVFVSDAFATAKFLGLFAGDLAAFKAELLAQWRAGSVKLTRCDLVGAYDDDKVADSEVTYLHATFHFLAMP